MMVINIFIWYSLLIYIVKLLLWFKISFVDWNLWIFVALYGKRSFALWIYLNFIAYLQVLLCVNKII